MYVCLHASTHRHGEQILRVLRESEYGLDIFITVSTIRWCAQRTPHLRVGVGVRVRVTLRVRLVPLRLVE